MDSIVEIWEQLAVKYGSRIALKDEITGYSLSFCELNEKINKVTQILENLDIEKKSNLLLCLNPHPLWHVIDQAIMKCNFVSVLCDSISGIAEIKYFIETMQIKVLFTDNIKLINALIEEEKINYIFYVGKSNINTYKNYENVNVYNLMDEINNVIYNNNKINKYLSNDVASIMFSSGTTGKSKGAMFTHKNLLFSFYDYQKISSDVCEKKCVNILSLSHVVPRLTEWALLFKGNMIIYTNYKKYIKTVQKYKPYFLMCVPKMLNLFIEQYKKEVSKTSKIFQLFNNIAFIFSYKYYGVKFKYSKNIINKFVLKILSVFNFICYECFIKNVIGNIISPNSLIFTFGAYTNKNIENIMNVIGLNLIIGYGVTEACVCISYSSQNNKKSYSAGKINPNMDVMITDLETGKKLGYNKIGMIKVKGNQIMKGYYNNENETKKVFDSQGYLITGDLGYTDEKNFLYFTGRHKNVIVLNNGENVDSVKIEEICNRSRFIKQIVVFGQDKPYLTALAVLEENYVLQWIKSKSIDINTQKGKELLKKEILIDINNLVGQNKFFRWTEQIKDIAFTTETFTMQNGLMTKKYTIVRNKVYDKYKNLIDDMYK